MDLKKELMQRADFFNKELGQYLKEKSPKTLYDALRHLPMAGGKRLRPVISMVSTETVNGDVKKVIPLAVAIEIIHNFTLVHDDIMDKSKLRRNMPTVHIKYGEPTAIMAGDLLFAKAFEVMYSISADFADFKRLGMGLIDCIIEICEGQQMDMDFEKRKIVVESEYIEMIRKKTAVLFEFAAEGGGILGGGSKKQTDALKEYGKCLGLAFQIHDDYLDMSSDEETLGKDIGNDIRNGKKTLIAVHCLNNATGEDKKTLEKIFGNLNASEDEVKQVYKLFKEIKSVEYAKNTALDYNSKAKKVLDVLDDSDAKQVLLQLAEYSIKREK